MKKLVCLLLSVLLLTGGALAGEAETRVRTLESNGVMEIVTETKVSSDNGYAIWYPAAWFDYVLQYNHDCFVLTGKTAEESESSYLIVPVDIPSEDAAGMLAEAAGGYEGDFTVTEYPEKALESGAAAASVQVEQDGRVDRYYLVRDEKHVLCITATYPAADAETVGLMYERMTDTIEFSEEAAEETGFDSAHGYSISYPAGQMEYVQMYGHDCFVPAGSTAEDSASSFLIVPSDVKPEDAENVLTEATGGYTGEYTLTEYPVKTLDSGAVVGSVQVEQDGVVYRFYVVSGGNDVLCITATYPAADAETVGVIYERMTETIEFEGK